MNEDLKHTRKDNIKEFARGDVLVRVGKNDYSAKVIIGFTKGNEMVLYDIIDFTLGKIDIKKVGMQNRPTASKAESSRLNIPTNNSISQNDSVVNQKDDKYSVDDTIHNYDDLTKLDEEEIKVYNNRGWALSLFNKEDRVLLNEKLNKLDRQIKNRNDNVLADGSRILEINNKIVLIDGTFDNPEICSVLVINAKNEEISDIYKEWIYNVSDEYKRNKYAYSDYLQSIEDYIGKEFIRSYFANDFRYFKGYKDSGRRAVSPKSFKNYGYTRESNNGAGNGEDAERGISKVQLDDNIPDIRYIVDDTLNDWLDDFNSDTPRGIDYERVVEKNPVVAVAGSGILHHTITNERLARRGYYDISKAYKSMHSI